MGSKRVAVAGTAVLTLVLAACGGGGSNSSSGAAKLSTSAAVASVCQGTPVSGGTLVYARQNETESLNPIAPVTGNGDIFADELLFNGLTRSDPNGSDAVQPALASSWDISPDGKTYTFHLRPGVLFSDGTPLTADDVKFSLDRFGNPKINTQLANVAAGYKSSTVINATTVQVNLSVPVASFLYNISIFPAFIVPKKLVEAQGESFWKHPVGTGPFVLQELVQGSHATFTKNTHYWESGKPYLNTVRFNFATDSNSRLLSVEDGQAQIADGVLFSQINAVSARSSLTVQSAKVPFFMGLWLNHKDGPLADLNVRKAMQYALNRQLMNTSIFRGVGTVPNSVLMSLKYDAPDSVVKPYPYDVTQAKAAMAASKYASGFSTTLQYPAGYDFYKQVGLLIQQEYAAIGIKVKLVEETADAATTNWSSSKYDMIFPFAQFTSDLTVPDEYAQFLAGDKALGLQGFFSNWYDASITKLVDQFITTTDEAARAKQWPVIQQQLMDQTPVINIMNLPFVNAHQKNVCGTSINALGVDHLENTWLAPASS
jgi:peptide/nickel transport system substrate-binding protein